MPPMNTPLKTYFCRIAFIALIAIPTSAILGYVAIKATQSVELTPEAWSSLLSERTGLEIRIGKLRREMSGVFVLEQLEIGDPESDETWVSAPYLEAVWDVDGLTLAARDCEIAASSMTKLGEHLQHRVLRSRSCDFLPLTLKAVNSRLLLANPNLAPLAVPELLIQSRMKEGNPELKLEANVIEDELPVLARVEVWRVRDEGKATTQSQWTIEGEEGLFAQTLAEFHHLWNCLGATAKFRGTVFDEGGDLLNLSLRGIQIENIDLAVLSETWGIPPISGIARIDGTQTTDRVVGAVCDVRNGKFTGLSAKIYAVDGAIDGRQLARLAQVMNWQVPNDTANQPLVEFDKMALSIQLLGDRKLRSRGLMKNAGVMVRDGRNVAVQSQLGLSDVHDVLTVAFGAAHSDALPVAHVWALATPRGEVTPVERTATRSEKLR
jgi:hypothetical protein